MSAAQCRTTSSTVCTTSGSGPRVSVPRHACSRTPTSAAASIVASTYGRVGPGGMEVVLVGHGGDAAEQRLGEHRGAIASTCVGLEAAVAATTP